MKTQTITTKTVFTLYLVILSVALSVAFCMDAQAGDQMLEFKADSMTIAMDKNGNEYTRFIVSKQATLNGHGYTYGVPVMAFGELHAKAQTIENGSTVKAIVNHRKLSDGRESYTIRAFIE